MYILHIISVLILSMFGMLLIIPIIVLGLPLWAVNFFTIVFSRFFGPKFVSWQDLIEFNQSIGWKPKPNLDNYYLTQVGDGVYHVNTDSQGWLGNSSSIDKSEVVVFGDSYAFGYGVNSNDCFFSVLSGKTHIKSIGAPGYNMVQGIILMSQLYSQLKNKLVVWFIYSGNDLFENLLPNFNHYRMPFVREVNGNGDWEIVTSHIRPERWVLASKTNYYKKIAEICSSTFLAQRAYSACEFLVEKARDICREANSCLVVVNIPDVSQMNKKKIELLYKLAPDKSSFDPDLPDRKIREICCKLDVRFVALKDHLGIDDYKKLDPHWNERGHKRVAEVLYGLYKDYSLKEIRV